MSDLRKNGQVVQPNVEYAPDNNGWPEALTDPSSPIRQNVSIGKNGESKMNDGNKTSQDTWSRPEGTPPSSATQPDTSADKSHRHSDPLKTSQMQEGGHHLPEGR